MQLRDRLGTRLGWLSLALVSLGCGNSQSPDRLPKPRFLRQVEWTGKGVWVKADTHTHTKFSDGAHTVEEVAAKAEQFGCDVLAITDHADRNLKAATRDYHEAIRVARRQHPDLMLFAGLEWNVPPWGGDEHATVLIHPDLDEWGILSRFKEQFDDLGRKPHRMELAEEALRWLEQRAAHPEAKPVVIYEHPSRQRHLSMPVVEDMLRWRKVNDLVIGFSGAPGHQRFKPLGSYKKGESTIDRWDPAAARIGDAWDSLLAKGLDVWAAHAPSDFHNDSPNELHDYWPGEFSETWLYVPDKSPAGVLRAFRAGTFFAAHGHIVRRVELTLEASGLPRPAAVGEVVELAPGTPYQIRLRYDLPPTDWQGKPNRLHEIELIGIEREATNVLATIVPAPAGETLSGLLQVPPGGIVIRARGTRITTAGANLLFYTNPIRVQTDT
jgi:hypothetical protein